MVYPHNDHLPPKVLGLQLSKLCWMFIRFPLISNHLFSASWVGDHLLVSGMILGLEPALFLLVSQDYMRWTLGKKPSLLIKSFGKVRPSRGNGLGGMHRGMEAGELVDLIQLIQ